VCSLKFNRTFCLECARLPSREEANAAAEEKWLAAPDSDTSIGSSELNSSIGSSELSSWEDEDNARTVDIFISGGKGRHYVINGLYSPTQETGQDGRMLYRMCGAPGNQALCIEHCEGRWLVKNQSDRGSGVAELHALRDSSACLAYVEGGCALEDCCSRTWKVVDGDDFVDGPSVRMVTVTDAD
jgi:hypothetical protein